MTCCRKTLPNNNFGYIYDFSIIHTCPNSQTQRVFESILNLDEIVKNQQNVSYVVCKLLSSDSLSTNAFMWCVRCSVHIQYNFAYLTYKCMRMLGSTTK